MSSLGDMENGEKKFDPHTDKDGNPLPKGLTRSPKSGAIADGRRTQIGNGYNPNKQGSSAKVRLRRALRKALKEKDAEAIVRTQIKIAIKPGRAREATAAFVALCKVAGVFNDPHLKPMTLNVIRQITFEDRPSGDQALPEINVPALGMGEPESDDDEGDAS